MKVSQITVDWKAFMDKITLDLVPDYEEQMSEMLSEDLFNCYTAEELLDVSFEFFPQKEDESDEMVDRRNEMVSDAMRHIQDLIIKKWAKNLGMVELENYENKIITNERCKIHGKAQYFKGKRDAANEFFQMSAYGFSKWKLEWNGGFLDESTPQDSEDEAWEQMRVFKDV